MSIVLIPCLTAPYPCTGSGRCWTRKVLPASQSHNPRVVPVHSCLYLAHFLRWGNSTQLCSVEKIIVQPGSFVLESRVPALLVYVLYREASSFRMTFYMGCFSPWASVSGLFRVWYYLRKPFGNLGCRSLCETQVHFKFCVWPTAADPAHLFITACLKFRKLWFVKDQM